MAVEDWVFYKHIGTQLAGVGDRDGLSSTGSPNGMDKELLEKLTEEEEVPTFIPWNCDFTAVASLYFLAAQ